MLRNAFFIILPLLLFSCASEEPETFANSNNWEKRRTHIEASDSLLTGSTYLSVYSGIYSQTEHRTHELTATVSMRNIDTKDTVYIDRADYFNTEGERIRTYFDKTIYIAPMETVEIVIDQVDTEGGTGGNFMFTWKVKPECPAPHFECVMISTSGKQGLSFSTQGVQIK